MAVPILALVADKAGCGWYRMRSPAREMRELGHDVTCSEDISVEAAILPDGATLCSEIKEDVGRLILQRPTAQRMHAVAMQAVEQGIAITVEIDDDFDRIHANHVTRLQALVTGQGLGSQWESTTWLRRTISLADRLVVSTPALAARYGRPEQVVTVMLNAMSPMALEICSEQGWRRPGAVGPSIGWTGIVGTHVDDLEQAHGAVGPVAHAAGWALFCLGDENAIPVLAGRAASLRGFRASSSEWVDGMASYYRAMADVTIGVVPLADSDFNRAKSDVKGQEMALFTGAGRAVASKIGEYHRLHYTVPEGPHERGINVARNRYADWYRTLDAVVRRTDEHGSRDLESRLATARTIDGAAWLEAWAGD